MLLTAAFNLLYNQFAWAYDWVSGAFFRGHWRQWQRAALGPLATAGGKRVLELGCGTGDLQVDLRARGYTSYGVDHSAAMLGVAQRKARRRGRRPLRVARAASQALPFPAETFDAVLSTFPSEYIFDPLTVSEIVRVLRPGGLLVVVPSGLLLPTDLLSKALDGFFGLVYGGILPGTRNAGAKRERLRAGLAQAPAFGPLVPNLRAAGFQVSVRLGTSPSSVVAVILAVK
ncbi:MAG: methyltransferase domain-containing protein [Actinomycetota bacterium]|nr:methyltransferase domain-containing protein [Actinomycetota bacterium]